jgi:D-aspartate ligase
VAIEWATCEISTTSAPSIVSEHTVREGGVESSLAARSVLASAPPEGARGDNEGRGDRAAKASNAAEVILRRNGGETMTHSSPAFVLTMPGYYGSLSAIRCLGQAGVPVIVADDLYFSPALWSRHLSRRERSPSVRPLDPFVDWLLAFGAREPGNVLYATSDDLAWIFAERQAELRQNFRLLTPTFECVSRLLDKRELYGACAGVGIATPRTWFPSNEAEVSAVAREARLPLLIKPRTQVLFATQRKARLLPASSNLRAAYEEFLLTNRHDERLLRRHPDIAWPMIQAFCGDVDEPVYSVSGFCDSRHGIFVARGSLKLIQWPRSAGVGIYFEDAPVRPDLAEKLQRLCQEVGFVGVFEAEFVRSSKEPLLIDFNPRFFGQMGFDIVRGIPSPLLVHLAALGETERMKREVEAALAWRSPGPMRFANKTALAWTRAVERLVGRKPASLDWASNGATSSRRVVVDAVADPYDWVPGVLDSVQQVGSALRHPRATLRAAVRRD